MDPLKTLPEGQIYVMSDIYMPDDSPSVCENNGVFHWLLNKTSLRSSMFVIHNTEISHFTEADSEFIIDLHQRVSKEKERERKKKRRREEAPNSPACTALNAFLLCSLSSQSIVLICVAGCNCLAIPNGGAWEGIWGHLLKITVVPDSKNTNVFFLTGK